MLPSIALHTLSLEQVELKDGASVRLAKNNFRALLKASNLTTEKMPKARTSSC